MTLWDAGELITALHTLGVPHPPGTPLFVLVGRAWLVLSPGVAPALAANLLSAAATAAACALLAALVARWLRSGWAGLAAALVAGSMAAVWRNATETEVYALALLLAAVTLAAADRAGRSGDRRQLVLVAYCFALAVPLNLFALVAAPAAVLLAATNQRGQLQRRDLLALTGALLITVGAGTVRLSVAAAGVAAIALAAAPWPPGRRSAAARAGLPLALRLTCVLALGLSVLAVLLVRARHDPFLNQGDPASWSALLDVVARRQYAVARLWPREAPLWLQLGNLVEYVDWQVALGLAPGPAPAWSRTPLTVAFVGLALYGARAHRRADPRSWRALLLLLAGASVGVVLYLNLKAGPSFGAGVLPPGAPREARERDYFFVFAFWTWGAWAGVGAVAAAQRLFGARRRWLCLAAALLPVALNWRAVDRARGPDALLARDVARALLLTAPPRAVLLTAGDNDSYPLWYLQAVEGVRPDVTVIVTPLLPAAWYRAEIADRHDLGAPLARASRWPGMRPVLRGIAADVARDGRPLLASALLPRGVRESAADQWVHGGTWYGRADTSPGGPAGRATGRSGDVHADIAAQAAVRGALLVRAQVGTGRAPDASSDPAARAVRARLLACAPLAVAPDSAAIALLASRCNRQ